MESFLYYLCSSKTAKNIAKVTQRQLDNHKGYPYNKQGRSGRKATLTYLNTSDNLTLESSANKASLQNYSF